MTTPAGWYDDGSGRQRWWDGTQWTEHFAPAADGGESPAQETAEPAAAAPSDESSAAETDAESAAAESRVPESAAAAETAAAVESISAVESGSWEQPSTGAPAPSTVDSSSGEPASAPDTASDSTSVGENPESRTPTTTPFTAPGDTAVPTDNGTSPYTNTAPGYPGSAPAYPGAAASYPGSAQAPQPPQAPGYGAAPSYPGSAPAYQGGYPSAAPVYGAPGGYPAAYPAAPTAPARLSVVGLIGLGAAALGTILSCIPFTFVLGWVLLAAGFIVSLISIFLKGRKWPGIAGLILSVVGTVIAVVMAFFFAISAVAGVVRDLPSAPPSSDSSSDGSEDDGTSTGPTEVVEGTLGEPVTVEQYSGTSEVTITSATWSDSDGSTIPATNGGFVILDVTVTGLEGTSYVNPIYFLIEAADGTEGTYDFFADEQIGSEDLEAGDSVSGKVTFDVSQSDSYTVIVTDEMLEEVARITVTPTAG
ncbi:DUF4352 domain-containing protein [Microbacterium sp. 1.5R]|uniref:DUF4352 domain-containing protein n=1 Tax=Microbacterium sp. 1.5R TaxID=1916917 RepID=UPI0011A2952F|nr:DUF2510 domain-containing protein [Microbacterium sp. 1.5R]